MRHAEPAPAPLCGKILLVITEDWFALSHFKPLIATLAGLAREVVVATRSSGRFGEIEALGARVVPIDAGRGSLNPMSQWLVVSRLIKIIRGEQPDAVHAVSMQCMVLTSAALIGGGIRLNAAVMHLTGLGFLGVSPSAVARAARLPAFWVLRKIFAESNAWLLAENPDDVAFMTGQAGASPARASLLPGAGIDPESFALLPPPETTTPVVAFVGRMLRQKGVHVLIDAKRLLEKRDVSIRVALYGSSDSSNKGAISHDSLAEWAAMPGITWHGHVNDIKAAWQAAHIAVVPTIDREGMPRAMLEAAACGRPLIVSDVPGCRHFVRHGEEGFIVPPGDVTALAEAMARLASDPDLRQRMGAAARKRVAEGYSTLAVHRAVQTAYREVLHHVRCAPGV